MDLSDCRKSIHNVRDRIVRYLCPECGAEESDGFY